MQPGLRGRARAGRDAPDASALITEAVRLVHGSRRGWNGPRPHLNWDADPAYKQALRLQFEAVAAHVAEERGIGAALDVLAKPVAAILAAADPTHPDVVRGKALLDRAYEELRSIDDAHPLVRYGILPSGYRSQAAAA